jgi:hypothetical protein
VDVGDYYDYEKRPGEPGLFFWDRGSRPSASIYGHLAAAWRPTRTAVRFLERQKGNAKSAFRVIYRLAITGKERDQSGTAPPNQKYCLCLSVNTGFNRFRAGRHTRAALPALSRSKPCAQGLTAGLRKGVGMKGQCGLGRLCFFAPKHALQSSCLPQRPTSAHATPQPCRMKP